MAFYINSFYSKEEVKDEMEKKEIKRKIQFWEGKKRYAQMRIEENQKKLKK